MRRSLVRIFLALLATGLALPATAQPAPTTRPLLWRIDAPTPSYLYGTIHVSDPRVVALPKAVRSALDASDVFTSEVRMDAQTQARAAASALLPAGNTLRSVLPTDLHERAAAYLAARDHDIAAFSHMKVWAFTGLLSLLDQLEMMARRPALDAVLYARAAKAGKRLDALEKVADQIALMDGLGMAGQNAMLRQTLGYLEGIEAGEPGPVERMIRVYLEGDEEKLMQVAFEYADLSDPLTLEFLDALLDKRNLGMASGIERRVSASPDLGYFFAVGALHLPGPEGIVALLEKRGFRVERVEP